MSDGATFCAVIIIFVFYCLPLLKQVDELENRIAEMQKQLDHIEKALYVIPDDGGDAE